MTPNELHNLIAGALYDFAGYLTTRDEAVTLGSCHNAAPAADLLVAWAKTRSLSLDDPAIASWDAYLREQAERMESAEPVAFMWQHEETGTTGFINAEPKADLEEWQRSGFARRRPIIATLYAHPAPVPCGPAGLMFDAVMPPEVMKWLVAHPPTNLVPIAPALADAPSLNIRAADHYLMQMVEEYEHAEAGEPTDETRAFLRDFAAGVFADPDFIAALGANLAVDGFALARSIRCVVEALRKAESALETAINGLEWYWGRYPESVSGSDDEAKAEIEKASNAIRAALAAADQKEPK